jgi:glycosyltransferase involved in cell wall biosynthesis
MLIGIDASRTTVARPSGTERYSIEIIRALIAAATQHEIVLYFNQPPAPQIWPSDRRVRARVIPSPRLWTLGRLSIEMAIRPPDVLFVPSHGLPLVLPRATVTTIHDLGYLHFPGEHPRATRWLRDATNRSSARRATRVIAVSNATRADLIRWQGVDPDRVTVVRHGCSTAFRSRPDDEHIAAVRARLGLERPYFLFVGTLQPRKNYERLLQAFDRIDTEQELVLAGAPGWQLDRLQRAMAGLRRAERVRTLGYVAEADLPAVIAGATALAYPSLYEGFGLPALEAMAIGTPVLTSNTSSLPEVVGEAGLLVDPLSVDAIADGLRRLASGAELRRDLAARGLDRARTFTWERAASQTLDVIEADANPR